MVISAAASGAAAADATAASAAASAAATPALHAVHQLPPKYRGVLLDQFGVRVAARTDAATDVLPPLRAGRRSARPLTAILPSLAPRAFRQVLHDGVKPYPGAIEAVSQLAAAGVRLLIISNSSRRSAGALGNLARLGFDPACFHGVVTSGEVAHAHLTQRPDAWWQGLGTRCLHFTWGQRGAISLEGLGLEVTTDAEQVSELGWAAGRRAPLTNRSSIPPSHTAPCPALSLLHRPTSFWPTAPRRWAPPLTAALRTHAASTRWRLSLTSAPRVRAVAAAAAAAAGASPWWLQIQTSSLSRAPSCGARLGFCRGGGSWEELRGCGCIVAVPTLCLPC